MGITPGPWEIVGPYFDIWQRGGPVYICQSSAGQGDSRADTAALIAAAPCIAAALVAIVSAWREPHYGDREQQADSVFDAMERTGALALVEKLKGIL